MIDDLTTLASVTMVSNEMVVVPNGCGCSCSCACMCPGETNLYSYSSGAMHYRTQLIYDLAWDVIYD